MTSGGDVKATISELMETNGFTGESRFYRYTLPEFLEALEEPGTSYLCQSRSFRSHRRHLPGRAHLSRSAGWAGTRVRRVCRERLGGNRTHRRRDSVAGRARPGRSHLPGGVDHHGPCLVLHAPGRRCPGAEGRSVARLMLRDRSRRWSDRRCVVGLPGMSPRNGEADGRWRIY